MFLVVLTEKRPSPNAQKFMNYYLSVIETSNPERVLKSMKNYNVIKYSIIPYTREFAEALSAFLSNIATLKSNTKRYAKMFICPLCGYVIITKELSDMFTKIKLHLRYSHGISSRIVRPTPRSRTLRVYVADKVTTTIHVPEYWMTLWKYREGRRIILDFLRATHALKYI